MRVVVGGVRAQLVVWGEEEEGIPVMMGEGRVFVPLSEGDTELY